MSKQILPNEYELVGRNPLVGAKPDGTVQFRALSAAILVAMKGLPFVC